MSHFPCATVGELLPVSHIAVLQTSPAAMMTKCTYRLTGSAQRRKPVTFEKLLLEVHANKAGWRSIKPPSCIGESGKSHRFSFLASDGHLLYGFDIFNDVTEDEVQSTYIKKLDTKVMAVMVNLSGKPKEEIARFADERGISIFGPGDVDTFFNLDGIEQRTSK